MATPATAPDDPFPDDLGALRTDRAIEERFLARYPLPTCDFVDTGTGVDPRPDSYDCLQEAVDAGDGAELVFATIRPGGDRAYVYYRRCRPSENVAEEPCA